MNIQIDNVIPAPLAGIIYDQESIWGKQEAVSSPDKILIRAASGKGKSTLLSLLYGLRNDYSGNIILDGKKASENTLEDWALLRRKTFSMMFQDLRLFGELTASQNILLKARLENSATEEEVILMAEKLGVAGKLQNQCKHLSLGQQQRIALIRCLVQPFSFLLLDEPFSHIDSENIEKAKVLIHDACAKNNGGLILTSLGESYGMNFTKTLSV